MHLKNKIIYKIGFWSSLFAFIGAIGFVISVVILQAFHLVSDLWVSIIGFGTSLIIPVPFLLAMLVLHYTVPEEKRFWTHAALLFGVIYASYVIQNYVVQLVSVIPAMLHGSLGTLDAFNQTPHSFLWDLDALGYMFMALSMFFASPVFEKRGLQKWLRLFFLVTGITIPLTAITYFYPTISLGLLIILNLPWAILIPGSMFLLALYFKKSFK